MKKDMIVVHRTYSHT